MKIIFDSRLGSIGHSTVMSHAEWRVARLSHDLWNVICGARREASLNPDTSGDSVDVGMVRSIIKKRFRRFVMPKQAQSWLFYDNSHELPSFVRHSLVGLVEISMSWDLSTFEKDAWFVDLFNQVLKDSVFGFRYSKRRDTDAFRYLIKLGQLSFTGGIVQIGIGGRSFEIDNEWRVVAKTKGEADFLRYHLVRPIGAHDYYGAFDPIPCEEEYGRIEIETRQFADFTRDCVSHYEFGLRIGRCSLPYEYVYAGEEQNIKGDRDPLRVDTGLPVLEEALESGVPLDRVTDVDGQKDSGQVQAQQRLNRLNAAIERVAEEVNQGNVLIDWEKSDEKKTAFNMFDKASADEMCVTILKNQLEHMSDRSSDDAKAAAGNYKRALEEMRSPEQQANREKMLKNFDSLNNLCDPISRISGAANEVTSDESKVVMRGVVERIKQLSLTFVAATDDQSKGEIGRECLASGRIIKQPKDRVWVEFMGSSSLSGESPFCKECSEAGSSDKTDKIRPTVVNYNQVIGKVKRDGTLEKAVLPTDSLVEIQPVNDKSSSDEVALWVASVQFLDKESK